MAYDAQLRKQFKWSAKGNLAQAFWPAMGASILAMLPGALISIIYNQEISRLDAGRMMLFLLVYVAALIFIVVPLQFGAMHYFTARARGQLVPVTTIFTCFGEGQQYKNALKLCFSIFFRSIGWIVLEIAAAVPWCWVLVDEMIYVATTGNDPRPGTFTKLLVLSLVFIVVTLLVNVKIRRFDGAYIRLIDDPDMSAWQATKECAITFRRHNWELFVFDLSFFPWVLLTLITLGIVGIYLQAYMNMAFVNYFDALRQHELGVPPVSFE